MTEAEWHTRPAPRKLLEHLEECHSASERKLRLFAVACCRRVQQCFVDPCQHAAVDVLERFANGEAPVEELHGAMTAVSRIGDGEILSSSENKDEQDPSWTDAASHAAEVISQATCYDLPVEDNPRFIDRVHDVVMNTVDSAGSIRAGSLQANEAERQALCGLLRDIFGNPFRPFSFADSWRSETVVAVATGIYAERAFDRMPILADALEEAGCDHPDVLAHCREPGPHVRGCWVVDLVLGKV